MTSQELEAFEEPAEIEEKSGPDGLRVILDRALCIGAAECVAAAPMVFRLDAQHRANLLDPARADPRAIWRAARSCPADAIMLENQDGEPLYP